MREKGGRLRLGGEVGTGDSLNKTKTEVVQPAGSNVSLHMFLRYVAGCNRRTTENY